MSFLTRIISSAQIILLPTVSENADKATLLLFMCRVVANNVIIPLLSKVGPQWREKKSLRTNQRCELFACPPGIHPLGIS